MTDKTFLLELEALEVNGYYYTGAIDVKAIATLMNEELLNYNRDAIHKQNVTEIKELLLEDKLIVTDLEFSIEDKGTVVYDSENNKLTLHENSVISIADGVHRCLGSQLAYNVNPNIDFRFSVRLTFKK